MHSLVIQGFVLCLSLWHGNRNLVDTLELPYSNLEEELSTSTFLAIDNISYVKTKLTYQDHLDLKRKFESTPTYSATNESRTELTAPSRRWWNSLSKEEQAAWYANKWHPNVIRETYWGSFRGSYQKTIYRLCYVMLNTYKAAAVDLEYYYPKRYFYKNIRDFEIGYLTHDIIHTYSSILELYHMMVYQYEMQNFTYVAPANYMFYIYTNMVLLGKQLIHQCNMIAEIENKYQNVISMFNDSTTTPGPDEPPQPKKIYDTVDSLKIIINVTLERQKDRQRKRKDERERLLENPTKENIKKYLEEKRKNKPFKSKWPLNYGWSIEENWQGYSYWSGKFKYSDEEGEEEDKNLENSHSPQP